MILFLEGVCKSLLDFFGIKPCPKKKVFHSAIWNIPYGMMRQSRLKKKAMTLNVRRTISGK